MFSFLNPYLFWIKLAGAALALAAVFGSGMWLEAKFKNVQIANLERDAAEQTAVDATASITQLQKFIANMHGATTEYGNQQDALFAAINKLHLDFTKAANLKPLPVDCRPDDERLRILSESVSAVNAAASGRILSGPVRAPQ